MAGAGYRRRGGGAGLALTGFGAYSVDRALGLTYPDVLLPAWLIATFAVAIVALVVQRSNKSAAPAGGTDTEAAEG